MGDVIDITDRLGRGNEKPAAVERPDGLAVRELKEVCVTRNCEMQLRDFFDDKDDARDFVFDCMTRFIRNDFGTLCQEEVEQNWRSIRDGGTVTGVYPFEDGETDLKAWLMLDPDGQTLTILMPEDYLA